MVLERRESIPDGWVHNGPAPDITLLNLRIALIQSNPSGLQKALYDVSTPSSPNYGKHLTKEEVRRFIPPRRPAYLIALTLDRGIHSPRTGERFCCEGMALFKWTGRFSALSY